MQCESQQYGPSSSQRDRIKARANEVLRASSFFSVVQSGSISFLIVLARRRGFSTIFARAVQCEFRLSLREKEITVLNQ